ncbi:MAG: hypothetical protein R6V10_11265 [bacterium]
MSGTESPTRNEVTRHGPTAEWTEDRRHERAFKPLVFLAVLAAVVLYLPTLGGGFLCDDYWYLDQAQTITFTEHPGQSLRKGNFYYFRPLPSLAWSAMYDFFSLHSSFYRAASLLLHVLTILAVAGLARRVIKSELAGGTAALLFAVFPLHPEAVAWVSANADMMAALFAALSLSAYFAWREGHRRSLIPALGFALLAMLSKESAYVIPVLALLGEFLPGKARSAGRRRRALAALFGVAAAVILVKLLVCGGQLRPPTGSTPISWWPGNLGMGLLRLFFPSARGAAAVYSNYLFVAALALALLSFALKKGAWKIPLFGALFALAALLPPASVGRLGPHLEFSRVMYLPSMGFVLCLAALLAPAKAKSNAQKRIRHGRLLSAVSAALACAALFAGSAANLKPWMEAGKASKAVNRAFLEQAKEFQPGQSVLVENLDRTYKGVPFHSNSYTLSVAFSMARFPEKWKERGFEDRHSLPVYAVLDEAPSIEARMTPVKKLRELKKSAHPAFDYHLVWETKEPDGK